MAPRRSAPLGIKVRDTTHGPPRGQQPVQVWLGSQNSSRSSRKRRGAKRRPSKRESICCQHQRRTTSQGCQPRLGQGLCIKGGLKRLNTRTMSITSCIQPKRLLELAIPTRTKTSPHKTPQTRPARRQKGRINHLQGFMIWLREAHLDHVHKLMPLVWWCSRKTATDNGE